MSMRSDFASERHLRTALKHCARRRRRRADRSWRRFNRLLAQGRIRSPRTGGVIVRYPAAVCYLDGIG